MVDLFFGPLLRQTVSADQTDRPFQIRRTDSRVPAIRDKQFLSFFVFRCIQWHICRLDREVVCFHRTKVTKEAGLKGRNTHIQPWYIKPKMANDKVAAKKGVVRGPKPKMTKEERRAKYTEIARKRRLKQQGGGGRGGRGNYGGGYSKNKTAVCYRCRQPGHTIAECPNKEEKNNYTSTIDNDDDELAEGAPSSLPSSSICYKCGSTEHSLSQCPKRKMKNKRKQRVGGDGDEEEDELEDLPFATCFLCKQKGHLVSSCPQNQRGIYINGGCCRICGSQQHRATDCPDNADKKKKKEKSGDGDDGSDDDDDSVEKLLEPVDHRTRIQTASKKIPSSSSKLKEKDTGASSSSSRDTTQNQNKKRRVVKF